MAENHVFHGEKKPVLFLKAFGVWLGMLVVAFVNGALRELLIVRLVGEQVGHVLSVFLLSGAIFGIVYLFVKALGPLPARSLLGIGCFWLVLSLLFEFGFFHFIMHEPWEKLLADYNIFRGHCSVWCGSPHCSRPWSVAKSCIIPEEEAFAQWSRA